MSRDLDSYGFGYVCRRSDGCSYEEWGRRPASVPTDAEAALDRLCDTYEVKA